MENVLRIEFNIQSSELGYKRKSWLLIICSVISCDLMQTTEYDYEYAFHHVVSIICATASHHAMEWNSLHRKNATTTTQNLRTTQHSEYILKTIFTILSFESQRLITVQHKVCSFFSLTCSFRSSEFLSLESMTNHSGEK